MAIAQDASKLKPSNKKNARWSQEDNAVLIDLLKSHQSKGHQSDSGWKGIVWTACEEALRGSESRSGGGPKTASGCKEHWHSVRLSFGDMLYTPRLIWDQMRKSYLTVKKLVNQSGWGWDDERKLTVAPSDVWDTYVAVRLHLCIMEAGY